MAWWAYDIETEDWDTLVCAVALSDDGQCVTMRSNAEVRDWYRDLPSSDIVWAHNGGGYDYIHLISVCKPPRFTWTARMAGSAIVSCRAKGHAECRDTTRLFPGSLDKWTGRKVALDLPCKCGEDCGGYCSISRKMSGRAMKRLVDYCRSDCEALLTTLKEDLLRLEGEGLSILDHRDLPRLTFGGVAWHTSSLAFPDRKDIVEWAEFDAGRRAYYGGRCEVGRVHAPSGHRYDVHAMYPWALLSEVPWGQRRAIHGRAARDAFRAERPGAYHATVEIPDTDIPPLPHRYHERSNDGRLVQERLLWTTGRVEGWWTHLELQRALDSGARIRKLDLASIWRQYSARYEPYVRHIYDARVKALAAGDDRWAAILKWYANALSGKLAQRPEATAIIIAAIGPEGADHLGGTVWSRTTRRLSPCSRPIEAAYLTSRARIKLLDRLERHSGRWLYCDTDSTYIIDRDDTDVHASELGAFGYEGACSDWRALAPKLYRYIDQDGRKKVRARGIPEHQGKRKAELNWAMIDDLAAGKTVVRDRGVERLKYARREGAAVFKKRKVIRTHHDWDTGRCGTRFIESDGTTRPLRRNWDGSYD